MTTGESKEILRPNNLKCIKKVRLKEETRILPWKDELIGVTDWYMDRISYNDDNLLYSVDILILGADDSLLYEYKNNQIIKDVPWRLIVGYDYHNLNEYKVKHQQHFRWSLVCRNGGYISWEVQPNLHDEKQCDMSSVAGGQWHHVCKQST